ncbi:SOS response-associated peptidase [Tenuifilum thalassicum]|uniref:Abasic site processing protein n=1 Tax=Tenuifilum thalassicum TaxID=2590900 RepID=A0A7D3XL22_9BACT|nr:SOS response-associated peptidase [Tenuifilum thalassicum]QKG80035.1 SOS response-associated peptidase [Tenuifilum thalassicum]
MCFTLSIQVEKHRLEKVLNAKFSVDYRFEPFYFVSAFDFPTIPVLSSQKPDIFTPMTWGLIPHWIKSSYEAQSIKSKTLNARFESILEKPSFKHSAKNNRCIIPATGFFEWQHIGSKKIPWFIAPQKGEIMQLAGIYSTWTNHETGENTDTFSIITVPANPLLEKIHNTKKRMPAILKPELAKAWLDSNLKTNNYSEILKPIEQEYLNAYTVSPIVSNPKNNRNTPDVLKPYSYPEQQSLF